MKPASIKEAQNGYNGENYITPRTLRKVLENFSPSDPGGSGGTSNYKELSNLPQINGVTLIDNITLDKIGAQPAGDYAAKSDIPSLDGYLTTQDAADAYQPKGDYQETLVSGTNIKTINGETLLGEGDIPISGGEGSLLDPLPIGSIIEYNGDTVPEGFAEVQEVSTAQRWVYNTQFTYNSITNNTWSLLSPFVETAKLPKGRYLAIYNIGLYAGGTGTVTLNAGFNDLRLDADRRASMPLTSGLITNTEITHYFELEEEKAVTLSAYAYSNANCSVNTFRVDIIKLDSEETGIVIDNAQEYSTEEKLIGTWVDGKKLYRKVIDYGVLNSAQGTNSVEHGISDIDKITKIEAFGYEGDYCFPIPHVGNAWMFAETSHAIRVNKSSIWIYVSQDRSMETAIVTLEYTKTTD